jgi:hypothetical protein
LAGSIVDVVVARRVLDVAREVAVAGPTASLVVVVPQAVVLAIVDASAREVAIDNASNCVGIAS